MTVPHLQELVAFLHDLTNSGIFVKPCVLRQATYKLNDLHLREDLQLRTLVRQ